MTYSSGIFADLDGDLKCDYAASTGAPNELIPDSPALHASQLRKLNHIIRKARIQPGHRVLDIGSGWGSFSLLVTQTIPETQVDTITLSVQQHAYVTDLVRKKGLLDRVRVHLMDYREMPREWDGVFDRVVSIEMVAHVGEENMVAYYGAIDRVMKRKDAIGVVQGITIPEGRESIEFIWRLSLSLCTASLIGTFQALMLMLSK